MCQYAAVARPELSFDTGFAFADRMVDDVPKYRGNYAFTKHFLSDVPALDGADDSDEFPCAKSSIPCGGRVLGRNVACHPAAFWLPVTAERTFPDFVAQLTDSRLLVVEYKGAHLVAAATEKAAVGALWQQACADNEVDVMVERERDRRDAREQFRAAAGPAPELSGCAPQQRRVAAWSFSLLVSDLLRRRAML